MKIYALIPARKGSKRLPHKNIREINGKLLVEYAMDEGLKSKYIDKVYVSSDDPVALKTADDYGVISIERPKELCTDTSTTQEMIDHFLMWLKLVNDEQPDAVVLLQPTSPLRTVEHINRCIETFKTGLFDSVATLTKVRHSLAFIPNGAVFVFNKEYWADNMGFVLMPEEESVDIDTELDFMLAEKILQERK